MLQINKYKMHIKCHAEIPANDSSKTSEIKDGEIYETWNSDII